MSNTKEITRYELYTINDSKSLYDKYKKSFINSCKKNNILNKKHEIIES